MIKRKGADNYFSHEPIEFYEIPRMGEYIGLDLDKISHIVKIVAIVHPIQNFENTYTIDVYANELGTEGEFLTSIKSL
ncbi:MAG: hypothetical protein JWR72_1610 [Flavisolibacter sp.]|nr:hypothetical protein [Flavisolibacter sp.]